MRATLPPAARLLRPAEYVHALKGQRVAKGALFVVLAPRTGRACGQQSRLGLIIAKRFARRAVTRNTIKRVIREQFRHRQHQLAPNDYVFRLYRPVPALSLTRLKAVVRHETDSLLDSLRS